MRVHELRDAEVLGLRAAGRATGTVYLAALALDRLGASWSCAVEDLDRMAATKYVGSLWSILGARSIRREVASLRCAWRRGHVRPCPWSPLPTIRVDPVELVVHYQGDYASLP